MTTYTGVADANGNFNILFGTNHTSGEEVTVTATKSGAIKTIKIYAPSEPVSDDAQVNAISFSGTLTDFPSNVGTITINGMPTIGASAFYSSRAGNLWASATGLVVGNSVTSIATYAFYGWAKATSVSISNSVKSIGAFAFSTWPKGLNLNLGGGVETIAASAFASWTTAKSLSIPGNVKSIASLAFSSWSAATSLTLNEGIQSIASEAFRDWKVCTSHLSLPNSLTSLGLRAFYDGRLFSGLTVGSGLTVIPDFAFFQFESATTLNLSEGLQTIGEQSFNNWIAIKQIQLPSTIKNIGFSAFGGMASCDVIICLAVTPPIIDTITFRDLKSTCIFKVPAASVAAYQAAANWSAFSSRIQAI